MTFRTFASYIVPKIVNRRAGPWPRGVYGEMPAKHEHREVKVSSGKGNWGRHQYVSDLCGNQFCYPLFGCEEVGSKRSLLKINLAISFVDFLWLKICTI